MQNVREIPLLQIPLQRTFFPEEVNDSGLILQQTIVTIYLPLIGYFVFIQYPKILKMKSIEFRLSQTYFPLCLSRFSEVLTSLIPFVQSHKKSLAVQLGLIPFTAAFNSPGRSGMVIGHHQVTIRTSSVAWKMGCAVFVVTGLWSRLH